MSNLTKPPILDDTGQDILTALGAIKQNLPQGGGSNGYAPTDATEATLADDDKVPFYDTSASGKRNSTWANIKAKLQSFFETIFVTISSLDGTVFVEKTYAEYDALSEAQKNDGKVEYFITDLDDIDYAVQDDPTATDLVNDEVPTGGTVKSWGSGKIIPAPVASTLVASKTDTSELTGTYTPTRNGRLVLYCSAGSANRTIKARMLSLEANVKYGNYIYTTLPAYNSESLMYLDVYKGVNYYYQCNGHGSAYIYMT